MPPHLSTAQYRAEDSLRPGQTTIRNPNIQVAHVEATSAHIEDQGRVSDGRFRCLWQGCTSHTTFSSHSTLMRHIKIQHVKHRSVVCPECGRTFGRVDNMRGHRGRRHMVFD
ncbi:Zinc finger C2H2-type/integrase DNA-binding domain [Penicillium roqueforti FM164]|uniref:Zinc finger C2H2-type/integrase DNA-binding domain n=1 Tax=Penicillium roqueforti (strain FM164) TaxID=1365484 RepID=W6QQV8_PENRF|nr:Zinc finger C2H2-type/integrase DNA-binding domain [Penicillium roqueforti FM164]